MQRKFYFGLAQRKLIFGLVQRKYIFGLVNSRPRKSLSIRGVNTIVMTEYLKSATLRTLNNTLKN